MNRNKVGVKVNDLIDFSSNSVLIIEHQYNTKVFFSESKQGWSKKSIRSTLEVRIPVTHTAGEARENYALKDKTERFVFDCKVLDVYCFNYT